MCVCVRVLRPAFELLTWFLLLFHHLRATQKDRIEVAGNLYLSLDRVYRSRVGLPMDLPEDDGGYPVRGRDLP